MYNLKNVKQHNAVIDKIEIRKNALIVKPSKISK